MSATLPEILREYRQLPWTNASCWLVVQNNYVFNGNSSKNLLSASAYYNALSPFFLLHF